MKTIITILTGISIFLNGLSFIGKDSGGHTARCTGSANCSACSNCSRCGHCSAGGSCGVCRGSSSKSQTKTKKKNSNSSYKTQTAANSGYGFYSGSSVSKNKKPVYYYNSSSNLSEHNFLYVIGNTINVRKGPGEDYPIIEKVVKNQKLIFLSEEGSWLKVIVYQTETEGYVYKKLVR